MTGSEKKGVLIAEDHTLIREGLRSLLSSHPDLEVIGEAGDGLELLDLVNHSDPDMIILDVSMPKLRGIEAIHEIRTMRPEVSILMLTMHKDKEYLYLALSAGAKGYLLKEDADRDLFSAIQRIRQGKTYVSPNLSEELFDDLVQIGKGEGKPFSEIDPLTTREREVVKLIAEGKSSKEIADLLSISARTVDSHRANIMEKLNLKKAADLVKYAIQKGYI